MLQTSLIQKKKHFDFKNELRILFFFLYFVNFFLSYLIGKLLLQSSWGKNSIRIIRYYDDNDNRLTKVNEPCKKKLKQYSQKSYDTSCKTFRCSVLIRHFVVESVITEREKERDRERDGWTRKERCNHNVVSTTV